MKMYSQVVQAGLSPRQRCAFVGSRETRGSLCMFSPAEDTINGECNKRSSILLYQVSAASRGGSEGGAARSKTHSPRGAPPRECMLRVFLAWTYYGVTPDICTMGKVISGGYALSAVAGRAEIMAQFDRSRVGASDFMPQIGTLSGNPIAAVAGLATLQVLKRPIAYETIFANGRAVWAALEQSLKDTGIPALILGEPPMFNAMFTSRPSIIDYRGTLEVDKAMSRSFHLAA
jgi:hypothetical protein